MALSKENVQMEREPSDANKLKTLIAQRGAIRQRVTKFKNSLNVLSSLETISSLELSKLALKLAKFETVFIEFDGLQSEIEVLNSEAQDTEIISREFIEQDFYHCIATAQSLLETNAPPKPTAIQAGSSNCGSSQYQHNDNPNMLGFKLPVIKIPNFDGSYYKWLEFKETYTSLIHDNAQIKEIYKFHYLNSYLEGEAARVVCNLEVSEKNYSKAWELLNQRYDNKRQLINYHLKALFSFDTVRETDKSLRFIIDHVTKNLRALATLGLPTDKWDILIIHFISAKLDNNTYIKWEEYRNSLPDIPSIDNFFYFLKSRADVLETVQRNKLDRPQFKPNMLPPSISQKTQSRALVVTSNSKDSSDLKSTLECTVCKGDHRLYECSTFKAKTPQERMSLVTTLNLCRNCLRKGHPVRQCRLPGGCKYCKRRHNTLLHQAEEQPVVEATTNKTEAVSMTAVSSSEILLCTAMVNLSNPVTGQSITVRALLDSGSQTSFITDAVRQKLNLSPQPSNTNIVGIGDTHLNINTERCALRLRSIASSFDVILSCLVLPTISGDLPKASFDISHLNLSGFLLADPSFNEPRPIDMLIGADLFWDIIGSEQHSLGKKNPNLQSSKIGWLIAGPMHTKPTQTKNKTVICNFLMKEDQSANFDNALAKFWEIENFPQEQPLSKEENLCEKHFPSNTRRLDDGRFEVALPLRDEPTCLGNSYGMAKSRFLNLEARFRKQPEVKRAYQDFIHEYEELGHLSPSPTPNPEVSFFLPHHPVIREQSESTRLRVVFDASARSTSGVSVNDIQMVGPAIQDPLFAILVRFRQHKFVLSGDIEKMFRQVLVKEEHRDLQLILWRDQETDPLRTLRLNTVTYGFASASFLTTRCLWQLGEESPDSSTKTIIQKDFYCDDLLTGADSQEELRRIQLSVSSQLAKGGFNLRKYRTNLPDLISDSNVNLAEEPLLISHATSTLGVGWIPASDEIQFQIQYSPVEVLTKRSILSSTFKIFDPLGLLSICTIKPKITLQELWRLKLGWDDPVPQEIQRSWLKFTEHLAVLSSLKLSRHVLVDAPVSIELHCFCDASQQAYGTCIYLRSTDKDGATQVSLLCAKSRVARLNPPTTIPRLELCAALLGAQLSITVTQALRCEITRHVYWTDSSVVIGWLQTPKKTNPFVANRVGAITELTDPSTWRHVPTSLNPADLVSRGVDPQNVSGSTIWWQGPPFLSEPESAWPSLRVQEVADLPELKAHPALVAEAAPSVQTNTPYFDIKRYSRFSSLQRTFARVLRFIHNCRNPTNKHLGPLLAQELDTALYHLLLISQRESFLEELALLGKGKPLPQAALASLNPFIDNEGILRVGGRIRESTYPYDKKHPILLQSNHHLTRLIFQLEHERLLHAGPQQLLASVRERYWPIGGRNLARRVARECHVCRRFKGQTMTNIMGNLPSDRVQPDFPFHTTGTDYAGPFLITDRKGRGCKITKCYLCIFVCFRYKCVHLELVSELSKNAFILTLKRFIARRGLPKTIYCDNGRNFVAADKEIKQFLKSHSDAIVDFAACRGIEFRFSPAYAPHFGGLWEAGVKSAKFHLHRVLKNSHLTFEELSTLFGQIEAILNSRPLCPLSSSPNDYQALTPGHFLIGRALTALPSPCLLDSETHRLNRFLQLEQCRQHFWKRWASEYVAELQQRTKWRTRCKELQLNDLVLIKEDAPPLCWRLGRVTRLYPGADGVPRVADVTTSKGAARRALNRLCLLPTTESQ